MTDRHRIFLLTALLTAVLLLSGCAVTTGPSQPAPPQKSVKHLVWPPPPQEGRITFLREIILPRDLRREAGLWSRVKEIFGGKVKPAMVRPYGLTVGGDDLLLIADPGAQRVHLFQLRDGRYSTLPNPKDHLALLSPIDVAIDKEGRIFVSDSAAGKVYRFNAKGRFDATLGEFQRPTGLVLSPDGDNLYVVDTKAHRVRVYNPDGGHRFDFGHRGTEPGGFNFPTNIALDRDGNIYVTDSMNFRVQAFDPQGNPLYTVGQAGDGPGTFSKPRGIGVDSDGHIYVADATFDNIQILNAIGQPLLFVGSSGGNLGQFYLPAGLFIDDRDRIFVADSFNRRVQVFQYLKKDTVTHQEKENPKVNKPDPILMLSREGSCAFILEKSSRTLFYFTMETDEITLFQRFPITAGELTGIGEGFYFGRSATGKTPDEKRVVLRRLAANLPDANGEDRFQISWGTQETGTISRQKNAGPLLRIGKAPPPAVEHSLTSPPVPFVVTEKIAMVPSEVLNQELREILHFKNGWEKSWESRTIESYVRNYSKSFRYKGMNRKEWKAYKQSVFEGKSESEITLRPLCILKCDPYVLMTFLQNYRSGDYNDRGIKKLLLRKEGAEWKILTEEWTPHEKRS